MSMTEGSWQCPACHQWFLGFGPIEHSCPASMSIVGVVPVAEWHPTDLQLAALERIAVALEGLLRMEYDLHPEFAPETKDE